MKYIALVVLAAVLTGCAGEQVIGRYNDTPRVNSYATNSSYFYSNNGTPMGYMNSYPAGR